jgi:hypothetical protein
MTILDPLHTRPLNGKPAAKASGVMPCSSQVALVPLDVAGYRKPMLVGLLAIRKATGRCPRQQ